MKGFDKFGVQELTRLEQREMLGGEWSWSTAGRYLGSTVAYFLDALEVYLTGYEPRGYNLDGLVGFSGIVR